MGLDSYLYRKEIGDTKFELSHPLCGGLFSGNGEDGSFRGKIYDDIIREATDGYYTLYVESLSPEEVGDLAIRLKEWYNRNKDKLDKVLLEISSWEVTPEEVKALVELFEQAAEKGCKYEGWW